MKTPYVATTTTTTGDNMNKHERELLKYEINRRNLDSGNAQRVGENWYINGVKVQRIPAPQTKLSHYAERDGKTITIEGRK